MITRKAGGARRGRRRRQRDRASAEYGSMQTCISSTRARLRARRRMGDNNADELVSCRLIDVSQEPQLGRKAGRASIAYLPLTQPGQENPSSADLRNPAREKALKGLQEA